MSVHYTTETGLDFNDSEQAEFLADSLADPYHVVYDYSTQTYFLLYEEE